MNPLELTVNQLQRAAAIKEQVETLNRELRGILGVSATRRAVPVKNRTMSAAAKKKVASAQKARRAIVRHANLPTRSVKTAVKPKKKTVSRATKAKLSTKLKAYWAQKKARKK